MSSQKKKAPVNLFSPSIVDAGRDYVHLDNSVTNYNSQWREFDRGIQILKRNIAVGAFYNAAERFDAPRCHPDTRVAVQNDIVSWAQQELLRRGVPPLLWISGPAGAGKSAIMQSVAERCSKDSTLAASFFFSHRSQERNNKSRLIATIAYQLAQRIPSFKELVAKRVADDETIFAMHLESQMMALILEPAAQALAEDPAGLETWPKSIHIDGLDECEGDSHQLDILCTFKDAIIRGLPFRVTFASRPEPVIRKFFNQLNEALLHTISLAHDYDAASDIRAFLSSEFNVIRRKYEIEEPDWPNDKTIDILVNRSSGQFVYAATVLRFVDDPVSLPLEHLDIVLEANVESEAENPFRTLDGLYTAIFSRCPDPPESAFAVAALNALSMNPGSQHSKLLAAECNDFLGWTSNDCSRIMGHLHSLLNIPSSIIDGPKRQIDKSDSELRYTLHHKSLIDFLENPIRAQRLHISDIVLYGRLCQRYLRLALKANADSLHDWGNRVNYEIPQFESWLLRSVPMIPELCLDIINPLYVRNWIKVQNQHVYNGYVHMNMMYSYIHAEEFGCRWYRCSRLCKVWRSTIVEECQKSGWEVASRLHILHTSLSFPVRHRHRQPGTEASWNMDQRKAVLFIPSQVWPHSSGERHLIVSKVAWTTLNTPD